MIEPQVPTNEPTGQAAVDERRPSPPVRRSG